MNGGIFLLQNDGELVEMREQPYDTEAMLQELLAKYPNLLAGDQMDEAAPRRWLFISREMGVPDEEDGGNRWSLDHLFLDQDAIPTLIEVKRSSDTRIRREVVGQMLDYAANAVVYWPVESISARFDQRCRGVGADPANEIAAFLGNTSTIDQFWQRVKTNLQAGRIRMVFVADEIPRELTRIVEFLNGQMDPAEILAVEIKQFVGRGLKTLVPRVIGQTAEAEKKKGGPVAAKKQWDEVSFLDAITQRVGAQVADVARSVLSWAKTKGLRIWWGAGAMDGSFFPTLDWKGNWHTVISLWTFGRLEFQFQSMKEKPPFDSEAKREELRAKLNQIAGVNISVDAIARRPSMLISTLTNTTAMTQFLDVLDWYFNEVKSR